MRTSEDRICSASSSGRSDTRAIPCLKNVFPRTAPSWTTRRSSGSGRPGARRSGRAASRAPRATRSARSAGRRSPLSRSSPRSSSIRTVSTAYRGTPCARSRICPRGRRRAGRARDRRAAPPSPGPRAARGRARRNCACPRPTWAAVGELGPREPEDEDRLVPRPLEEVLDEVQQAGVRPLHVLEHHDDRVALREALEEDPPGREHVLLVAGDTVLEPQQMREPGLDPIALLRVGDELLDGRAQLLERRRRLLLLGDAAPHLHHLDERPVGHALAVGQAAPSMPQARRRRGRRRTSRTPTTAATCRCRRSRSPRRCALLSSAEAWKSSLIIRSSRSRPTKGASSPEVRRAPSEPATTRTARHRCTGSALPFISCAPASS